MTGWELLTCDDPGQRAKWRSICDSFDNIDIFYYPEYLRLFELHGDGKPYLFVYYESSKDLVIYPFLKRSLREIPEFQDLSKDLFDITSPYGYGGYLRNNNSIDMNKVSSIFAKYCEEKNIVSEFIRFNPVLNNTQYAPKVIDLEEKNKTIIINLYDTEDKIWSNMASRCRNSIRKAIKNNVKIINDTNFSELKTFYNLYTGTMTNLGAQKYYFFSLTWFDSLKELLKNKAALYHAYHEGKIIASSLFIYQDNIINYFLSGSLYEMRHLSATNLLLYEVALWSKKLGIKYFHLGGGYSKDDSLYHFKASFSPHQAQYYVGKVIHNNKDYERLSNMRKKLCRAPQDLNYFPFYRAPQ